METNIKATEHQIWQDKARHIGEGQAVFSKNTGPSIC